MSAWPVFLLALALMRQQASLLRVTMGLPEQGFRLGRLIGLALPRLRLLTPSRLRRPGGGGDGVGLGVLAMPGQAADGQARRAA